MATIYRMVTVVGRLLLCDTVTRNRLQPISVCGHILMRFWDTSPTFYNTVPTPYRRFMSVSAHYCLSTQGIHHTALLRTPLVATDNNPNRIFTDPVAWWVCFPSSSSLRISMGVLVLYAPRTGLQRDFHCNPPLDSFRYAPLW